MAKQHKTLHQKRLDGELHIQQPVSKVSDHVLPVYTKGEEIFNMVSHIVGAAFGLTALVMCVVKAALNHNVAGIVCGAIYGLSMILVYTISSVYHGLDPEKKTFGKKVMQVLDHCDIYCLIAGTITPIALTDMRLRHPVIAWTVFGIFYGVCLLGQVLTAIDFHKFAVPSYACYFVAGWSALLALPSLVEMYGWAFPIFMVLGGVFYSSGMIFFDLQKRHRYAHSVFHLFIVAGSVLQFIPIYVYCM